MLEIIFEMVTQNKYFLFYLCYWFVNQRLQHFLLIWSVL